MNSIKIFLGVNEWDGLEGGKVTGALRAITRLGKAKVNNYGVSHTGQIR